MEVSSHTKFLTQRGIDMKAQKVIYLSAFLLLLGCSSLKKSMIITKKDLKETVINNAIIDFSTNCDLFKKDSVFSVNFQDSVFNRAVLEGSNEHTYSWKRGALYDQLVSVEIGASYYKHYYSEDTKGKLPTQYIIKNGKLFYWWDDNVPVTKEIIAVLWRYNLLQTDFLIPNFSINDNQKGAHYYFCKNDLSNYKRVITKIGLGYYKPPKLRCN